MKKKIVISIILAVVLAAFLTHVYFMDRGRFTTEPVFTDLLRSYSEHQLVSPKDPQAVLQFDESFKYLGGQKFILYGVADTEQHFFAETTGDDKLKSLYWVQFEGYLPNKNYTYDYEDSPGRLEIDGFDFFLDTEPVYSDPNGKRRRGTDGAYARTFVASKGYTFPEHWFYARLVHLTDAAKNKELMIIYIEDVALQGLDGQDLMEGGADADRWPAVEKQHLEKIKKTLHIQ